VGALAVDALTFLLSVPLLLLVPRLPPGVRRPDRLGADAMAGLRYTFGQRAVRGLAVGFLLLGLTAADDVALPFLARALGAGERGIGGLYAAVGGGLLAGYLVLAGGRREASTSAIKAVLAGGVIASAGNALTGLAPSLALAVSFQVVRGLGLAVYETTVQTAIQRSVPDYLLGRVFANVYGAVNLSACLGLLAGGVLLDATSARVVLVVCGAVGLVATVASGVATRHDLHVHRRLGETARSRRSSGRSRAGRAGTRSRCSTSRP